SRLTLFLDLLHITSNMINITSAQLRKAADLQEQIQELQQQVNQILGGEVPTPAQPTEAPKKKGEMSAAGRAAISAAAKARWAKRRGITFTITPTRSDEPAPAPTMKPKIQRSAAWKAALSASAKARWAKVKAQGK
ncbi:MAG: hypothetical protein WCT12_23770, partial [Verrucomicrobiota bacterium]